MYRITQNCHQLLIWGTVELLGSLLFFCSGERKKLKCHLSCITSWVCHILVLCHEQYGVAISISESLHIGDPANKAAWSVHPSLPIRICALVLHLSTLGTSPCFSFAALLVPHCLFVLLDSCCLFIYGWCMSIWLHKIRCYVSSSYIMCHGLWFSV